MADLEARKTIQRLLNCATENDTLEALNYVREAGLQMLFSFKTSKPKSIIEKEAHLLFSMTILKCDSLLHLAKGYILKNSLDKKITPFVYDPFSIMTIVRSQFEAFCTFHNIFVYPKSLDEQRLFYLLWVISGLKYRQRFQAILPEIRLKKEREKEQIERLEIEIKQNPFFTNLNLKNKEFILERLKKKEWQCYFDGNNIVKAGWEELAIQVAGCRENMIQNLYSFLSLSTHPSNVSVFQFKDIGINDEDKSMTRMGVILSKFISAMMIADFANVNDQAKRAFEALPPIRQALINMINQIFRTERYTVNDIHKKMLND